MDYLFLDSYTKRINNILPSFLPPTTQEPKNLHEAMSYAVLNGGKRIRALLIYAIGETFGATKEQLDIPACTVELIHAYSLVHDDLPAMDDDDLRRGKPSCHKAYGEAMAILAGDALQTLAFEILSNQHNAPLDSNKRLQMIYLLAKANNSFGMAGGQALDLDAVGRQISLEQLERIHHLKTGALILASVKLGALTAQIKDEKTLKHLESFAHYLGLAFQIHDDILDVEGETEILGKNPGSDSKLNKPTYPGLIGLELSKIKRDEFHAKAVKVLNHLDCSTDLLRVLANYVVERRT